MKPFRDLTDPNLIPDYLIYQGIKYKFSCNKGNTLCYTYFPKYMDDSSGYTLIVEHRKNKRWCDRFYVLYLISAYSTSDYTANCSPCNLSKTNRQAVPEFE